MRELNDAICGMPGCKELLHSRHDVVCRTHWDQRRVAGLELVIACPVCLHGTQPALIRADRGDLIECEECGSVIAMYVGRKSYVVVPGGKIEVKDENYLRLKIWPSHFLAVESERMKCQWRRDDEHRFEIGDVIILEEWDPSTNGYTGKELKVEVTHVLRAPQFQIPENHAVLSIKVERKRERNGARNGEL